MKYIVLLIVLSYIFFIPSAQSQDVSFKGEVIGYVQSQMIVPPHGYIPNMDELIVKTEKSGRNNGRFVRIINEYFEEKSSLPRSIFDTGGRYLFVASRRLDCDGAARIKAPVANNSVGEVIEEKRPDDGSDPFTMNSMDFVAFFNKSYQENPLLRQSLRCYRLISIKRL